MRCRHVRILYGHMRMREKVAVKVCAKYKIGINCISLEISLYVESCKPMWNLTLRYKMYAWKQYVPLPLRGAPLPRDIT